VLEALLGDGRIDAVQVWVERPLAALLPRLATRHFADAPGAPAGGASVDRVAVLVFDRRRGRHGREAAFWMPEPADLVSWALARHAEGVRSLVVVSPVNMTRWPAALREGLATLDEQAVSALDWQHLVWVRPAERAVPAPSQGLQRVADQVLAQLHWMVPTAHQPLRASAVSRLVAGVVTGLATWSPATRVLAADTLWQLAQAPDAGSALQAWWTGAPLPRARAVPRRL
jgi:hypothetical protein